MQIRLTKRSKKLHNKPKGSTMLRRKFLSDLLTWKIAKKNECLLVKGARQIGKTFIIDKFGNEFYKQYFYINFLENPGLKMIFEGSLEADEIYKK